MHLIVYHKIRILYLQGIVQFWYSRCSVWREMNNGSDFCKVSSPEGAVYH